MTEDAGLEARGERIREVIDDFRRRQHAGRAVSEQSLIEAHGELMPELAAVLAAERLIAEARAEAEAECADAQTTAQTDDTGTSGGLHIRCPHCHNSLKTDADILFSDITCTNCGNHFSLIGEKTETRGAEAVTQVGHFELVERLGLGGFGTVWKARDTKLDRTVAVKIPRKGQLEPAEVEQLLREARTTAQLHHPNIVSVHEVGRDGDTVYIVTDLVRGVPLSDWLAGGRPSAREAAELCRKIAEALQHAHEMGVIHRDLKPQNIMMDGDRQPQLMDFGLARREAGEVTVTLDGQVLGTPAYMSPEQAQGEAHRADRRSDVYSLGVILFELLTGELPFRGSARMLIHQVIHDEVPSPRKLNGSIPRDLETICLKCLEKEAHRRYHSAQVLADDLNRFLRNEPILTRPVGRAARVWRWCRRNPAVASLATGVAVTLLAGIAVSNHFRIQVSEKLWTAYLAQAQARRWSNRPGQRTESLRVLSAAAAIRPSVELRNEAIACMALTDIRLVQKWKVQREWRIGLDPLRGRYLYDNGQGDISLRRIADNSELFRLPSAEWQTELAIFSPDGQLLAQKYRGERDEICRVWDLNRRQVLFEVPVAPDSVSIAFSPGSRSLIVAGPDGLLHLYGIPNGKQVGCLSTDSVPDGISFLPHSRQLAVFWRSRSAIEIWDWHRQEVVRTITFPSNVYAVAGKPGGRHLAASCRDFKIYVWDIELDKRRAVLDGHQSEVIGIRFNHAGDVLASRSWDATVRLWDPFTGKELLGVNLYHRDFRFRPDGRLLFQGIESVGTWEVSQRVVRTYYDLSDWAGKGPWCVDFSSDGRLLASAGNDGVRLYDLVARRNVAFLPLGHTMSALFTQHSPGLITNGASGLQFWPVRANRKAGGIRIGPSTTLEKRSDNESIRARACCCLPAGCLAAITGPGRITVRRWKELDHVEFDGHPGAAFVAASRDGQWVATGNWGGSGVRVWDVPRRRLAQELLPDERWSQVAFSPDSRWLVTSTDHGLQFWKVGSWEAARRIVRDPAGMPSTVAFSPDGGMLAMTQARHLIRLVDSTTSDHLATLESADPVQLTWLDFSPDGSKVAAASENHRILVWDLRGIRQQLATMGLDWNRPQYPAWQTAGSPEPLKVELLLTERSALDCAGVALCRQGKWQEAIAALQQSMESCYGGNALEWLHLARAYGQAGDKEQAGHWYRRAHDWLKNGMDEEKFRSSWEAWDVLIKEKGSSTL